jgi:hypothetical protein
MPRDYKLYLEDILEAIEKTERYTRDMTIQQLGGNSMVFDAVLPPPGDFADPPVSLTPEKHSYAAQPRSAVILTD